MSGSQKIRVMQIVVPFTTYGRLGTTGPERRAANAAAGWGELGIDAVVLYPRRGILRDHFVASGVQLIDFDFSGKNDVSMVNRIADIAGSVGAHVIHTQGGPSVDMQAVFAGERCKIPVVVTRPVMLEYECAYSPMRRKIYRAIDRMTTLRMADRIVAVNADGAAYLSKREHVPASRLQLIYNGVKLDQFSPRTASNSAGGAGEKPVVLGAVGHLTPYKGWKDFLAVVARLRDQDLNIEALVVGEGEQRSELEALTAELRLQNIVRFLGFRDDMPQLLPQMDIFFFPSLREGLSVAIIEAMAAGLPVVSSLTGGIREQVVEGQNGHILEVHDLDGMTAACRALIRDPNRRASFGQVSRHLAEVRFDQRKMISDYAACYRRLAALPREDN